MTVSEETAVLMRHDETVLPRSPKFELWRCALSDREHQCCWMLLDVLSEDPEVLWLFSANIRRYIASNLYTYIYIYVINDNDICIELT